MPALASAVSRAPVLHTHYHAGQRPSPPLPWDENKPTGAHCIADLSWPACVHDSDSQRLCAAARVFLLYCAGWQRPLPQQRPVVRPTGTSPHLASRARPPVAQMHTMRHRRSVHEHPHGPTQTMIRIAQSSQLTSKCSRELRQLFRANPRPFQQDCGVLLTEIDGDWADNATRLCTKLSHEARFDDIEQ